MGALDLSIYAVSDPSAKIGVIEAAEAAARGGATLVQLRDKSAEDDAFAALARELIARLAPLGVPLIVNDRVEIARAVGAAGAHVGQSDLAARAARDALGPEATIGLSIETPAQLAAVDWDVVDYVGAGPVRATATKPDHAAPLGFDGLAEICAASPAPVVAIGGLGPSDVEAARRAGAQGIALVSTIFGAEDPERAARDVAEAWRRS